MHHENMMLTERSQTQKAAEWIAHPGLSCFSPALRRGLDSDWSPYSGGEEVARAGRPESSREVELCYFGWNKRNSNSSSLRVSALCHALYILWLSLLDGWGSRGLEKCMDFSKASQRLNMTYWDLNPRLPNSRTFLLHLGPGVGGVTHPVHIKRSYIDCPVAWNVLFYFFFPPNKSHVFRRVIFQM